MYDYTQRLIEHALQASKDINTLINQGK